MASLMHIQLTKSALASLEGSTPYREAGRLAPLVST